MKKRMTRTVSYVMVMLILVVNILGVRVEEVNAATESQNNIVARADYLYNITWVCTKTVAGWRGNYTFVAGETYRIPYGQPAHAGKYIGFYVSVDKFLEDVKNPNSAFYNYRSSCSGKQSVYYATDCSAFVSWCWGAKRNTTATLHTISTYIGKVSSGNLSKLQLGDALNSTQVGHVVLVTDLVYDANGALVQIEITEQTPPQLLRSYYTPEELVNKYGINGYKIYRYNGKTPAAPASPVVNVEPTTTKQPETTTVKVEIESPMESTIESTIQQTTANGEQVTTSDITINPEIVTTVGMETQTSQSLTQEETTTQEVTTTQEETTQETSTQVVTTEQVTTKKELETTTKKQTTTQKQTTTKKTQKTTTEKKTTVKIEETTTLEETTTNIEHIVEETTTYGNTIEETTEANREQAPIVQGFIGENTIIVDGMIIDSISDEELNLMHNLLSIKFDEKINIKGSEIVNISHFGNSQEKVFYNVMMAQLYSEKSFKKPSMIDVDMNENNVSENDEKDTELEEEKKMIEEMVNSNIGLSFVSDTVKKEYYFLIVK